jgi:hypothetical protein
MFIVELDDEALLCHMYLYVIMLYVGNFEYMGVMEYWDNVSTVQ